MAKATPKLDPSFVKPSDLASQPVPDHDGKPIRDTDGSLVKTGHGFEETLKLQRMHIPIGARVMVLTPARCVSHEYDIASEGTGKDKVELDEFDETAILEAESVLLIDPDLVAKLVIEHNDRVEQARAEADRIKAEERAQREDDKRAAAGEFKLPDANNGDPLDDPTPIRPEPDFD
jgi:hypothetical protein